MLKNLHLWLPEYFRQAQQAPAVPAQGPVHVMVALCDHFEPKWQHPDMQVSAARVNRWVDEYPQLAGRHHDSDGAAPQYTFFYPGEEYEDLYLRKLAQLCRQGYGEVEVHLHHDLDTAADLRDKLTHFMMLLSGHGLLGKDKASGRTRFGFIHGNWALDNSRPDGRWCGVNNELDVLRGLGCYADFTFPSAPDCTQPRTINSIYYAYDDPQKPKSHDVGVPVSVGKKIQGALMLIQGPLTLNWRNRSHGIFPRIENAELSAFNPPTAQRADLWAQQRIQVLGRPEWIFIKLHTHGTQEKNMDVLLGKPMDDMFTYLETKYNDQTNFMLHYVNARQMYNIVKAAAAGETGNPHEYRDYEVVSNIERRV